jgi:hypothetical protein
MHTNFYRRSLGKRKRIREDNITKSSGEELIAYFPLIRHGLHIKRNNYVDTHRQQVDLIIYTRNCGDFYRAVA